MLAILNSAIAEYYSKSVFVEKQNGYYEVQPEALKKFPIPNADPKQRSTITRLSQMIVSLRAQGPHAAYFERLLNGLVYELFFPEELHGLNLHFFDLLAGSDLPRSAKQPDWEAFHARVSDVNHPIYAALFALNGLEVVRIIEGRE